MSVSFGVVDYTFMGMTIVVSLGIGLYHGFKGNKTPDDFSMGSRSMRPFPVALSLLATFLSANSILGYTGEVYGHGLELLWLIPGTTVAILFAMHVALPILYPLKLVSSYQYLEMRFGSTWLRLTVVGMSFLSLSVFMGLALYTPALALATVTPIPYTTHIWIMGVLVTVYSSVGGFKGVVWADVFQMAIMFLGIIIIAVMASVEVGGPVAVWDKATEGGRTQAFNLDFSPYTRHTVWNVLLLTAVNWGSHYSVLQPTHQRISSVPTYQLARRMLYCNIIGMALFFLTVYYMSLAVYAVYAGCDPYARGLIKSKDQIVVFYAKDKLSHLPGMPGVFVATMICASFSTLSSLLNTLATLLWSDYFATITFLKGVSHSAATTISKLLTLLLGSVTLGLAFLAAKMGGIMQAGYVIVGVMSGAVLGVFLLGMAVPFSNKFGAFSGLLIGWGLCVWIAVGAQLYKTDSTLLPFSLDTCPTETLMANGTSNSTFNTRKLLGDMPVTLTNKTDCNRSLDCQESSVSLMGWARLYSISYTLYPLIGLSVCLIIGTLVSLLTGRQDTNKVPANLVLPCVRRYVAPQGDDELSLKYINR